MYLDFYNWYDFNSHIWFVAKFEIKCFLCSKFDNHLNTVKLIKIFEIFVYFLRAKGWILSIIFYSLTYGVPTVDFPFLAYNWTLQSCLSKFSHSVFPVMWIFCLDMLFYFSIISPKTFGIRYYKTFYNNCHASMEDQRNK